MEYFLKCNEPKHVKTNKVFMFGIKMGLKTFVCCEVKSSSEDDTVGAIIAMSIDCYRDNFFCVEAKNKKKAFEFIENEIKIGKPKKYPLDKLQLIQFSVYEGEKLGKYDNLSNYLMDKYPTAKIVVWDPEPIGDCIFVLMYNETKLEFPKWLNERKDTKMIIRRYGEYVEK